MSICNDSLGSLRAKRKLFDESIKTKAPQPFECSQPVTAEAAQSLGCFTPFGFPPDNKHVTTGQAFEALQCFDSALLLDSKPYLLQAAQRLVACLDSEQNLFKGIELPKHMKEALEAARTVLGSRPAVSD